MTENVYIHIPFCKSKCRYCSFVSFPELKLKTEYLTALKKEIKIHYKNELLNTLYLGGGTPSLLNPDEITEIIKLFKTGENTEITMELNPENLLEAYLNQVKDTGINRISIGCQTFDDNILKLIGRRHNAFDVKNALLNAKNAGFENISLDFIYGLPYQTLEIFENDLKTAVSCGIKHISLYGLKIDEGCYFYENMPSKLPDEDVQADMYLKAIELLTSNDFEHYEISNFSKKGYNSKHNLNYWNNNSYYGFGTAAHGYVDGIRYSNTSDLQGYIKNPQIHNFSHELSLDEKLEEEIFLGFRKMSGININEINKKFDIDFCEKYRHALEKYSDYFLRTPEGFSLTVNGILISNTILAEFLQ